MPFPFLLWNVCLIGCCLYCQSAKPVMDKFSKSVRSGIMRAVKSRGNKSTEIKMLRFFKEREFKGWRRNYPVYGRPDFVFPKKKIAVFADGCFWHGHGCRNLEPKNNHDYWENKISGNKKRDKEVKKRLTGNGWWVFRIFECRIKKSRYPEALLKALG